MSAELLPRETDDRLTATYLSLQDSTCVVTGASRGIGCAIASALGRSGANVVVNYRSSESDACEVAESIDAGEGRAVPAQADVGNRDDVLALADHVHEEFGPIDVLVNNAGINIDKRFDQLTVDDWNQVIDVNLGGAFHCTKVFYDDIKASDHGRLINISSVIGQVGNYGQSNYAASKSALFGFTRTLAIELAPYGSTANCVAPGFTNTEMVEHVREDIKDRIREEIPLRRFASTEEIANVVTFLASDDSSYITGEVLNVNGGMYG